MKLLNYVRNILEVEKIDITSRAYKSATGGVTRTKIGSLLENLKLIF